MVIVFVPQVGLFPIKNGLNGIINGGVTNHLRYVG